MDAADRFEELGGGFRSYAAALLGSHSEARDLVDYVLRSSLDPVGEVAPSIRLTNRLVDLVREHSVTGKNGPGREGSLGFLELDDETDLTIVQARMVVKAIEAMENDLCRAVLIWHWLGGVSAERIAGLLGCGKRSARHVIHQALRKLTRELQFAAVV